MQTIIQRIILVLLTIVLCVSGTMVTYAQTSSQALKQELAEKQRLVNQKAQEKQTVNKDIENIKLELESLQAFITKNNEAMAETQKKIDATNQLIEKKKEEIVILEDKILARKDIMKQRAVALQQNDSVNLMINIFFESDSISDFIQRASAASALMDADKDILNAQKEDLLQIEEAKKEIDRQGKILEEDQKKLAQQQAELNQNLQKRQQSLTVMQQKLSQIVQPMPLAEKEKAGIQAEMNALSTKIASTSQKPVAAASSPSKPSPAPKGKEMYVSASAYTAYCAGCSGITTTGYNLKDNPNIKMIAVDPRVIPLGSKVWVEGYGVAIAGDTGGAIKGHKIDVFMPTKAQAMQWGRRTVKIVILE